MTPKPDCTLCEGSGWLDHDRVVRDPAAPGGSRTVVEAARCSCCIERRPVPAGNREGWGE